MAATLLTSALSIIMFQQINAISLPLNAHTCRGDYQTLYCRYDPRVHVFVGDANEGVERLVFERFWLPATLDVRKMADLIRIDVKNGDRELCTEIIKNSDVALYVNGRRCTTLLTTKDFLLTSEHPPVSSSSYQESTDTVQSTTVQLMIETTQENELTTNLKVIVHQPTAISVKTTSVSPSFTSTLVIGWTNLGTGLQVFIVASIVLLLLTLSLFTAWVVRGTQCRLRRSICNSCCRGAFEERVIYSRNMPLSDF